MCILRQFLYDTAESVRLAALSAGSFLPLAQLATKLRSEEKYHMMHGRSWILRLGNSTQEAHEKLQTALYALYPHALGMFEPTEADETLAQLEICPREVELRKQWESAVAPVLADSGLSIPEAPQPIFGGRVGRHPDALKELVTAMQSVFQLDPTAKW